MKTKTSQARTDAINTEATMSDRSRHFSRKPRHRARLGGLRRRRAAGVLRACPSFAGAALLKNFTAEVRDQNGDPYTQAGGHPFEAFTDINFRTHEVPNAARAQFIVPDESVRTVHVDLPAGLVGNPQNIPQCTHAQLTGGLRRRLSRQHPGRRHGAQDRARPELHRRPSTTSSRRRACRPSSASSP